MTLHILHGGWWYIVCPPSVALLNCRKGFISIAEYVLLPDNQYSDVHESNPEFYPNTDLQWRITLISLCYSECSMDIIPIIFDVTLCLLSNRNFLFKVCNTASIVPSFGEHFISMNFYLVVSRRIIPLIQEKYSYIFSGYVCVIRC